MVKQQFDKCFFNPMEKNLLQTYPKLNGLVPTEVDEQDKLASQGERLLRYILLLYDPKSPIVKENPDLNSRKIAAAVTAGYDTQKETELLETIYTCDSEYMVSIIVGFLRTIVQSRVWASLQADEQTFWEFIYRMMLPITREKNDKDQVAAIEKKTALSSSKEDIMTRIDNNLSKFLGDDEELKKKVRNHDFSPEAMAGVR